MLELMLSAAFPGARLLHHEPLPDGHRNTNYKLQIDRLAVPVVLRIYQHEAWLCRKELDLLQLLRPSVPVPEVIYAAPEGIDDSLPFLLMSFIDGVSFRQLRRAGETDAIAQAAFSAGETLAAIGRTSFSKPGWLGPGLSVIAPLLEGDDPIPRFIDQCLASGPAQLRLTANLRARIHSLIWSQAPALADAARQSRLVHGDFHKRNLLVHQLHGRWKVAGVLDWEFSISSSPLTDIGNFLRNEPASFPLAEPHFSAGFLHAGGTLPEDWRRQSQLIDLTAICELLSRTDLPTHITSELLQVLQAT